MAVGRVAAAAQAGERGHARVVPAGHVPALDEVLELALGQREVRQVEARELGLLRARHELGRLLEEPVVQRPVVLELERADRVGDALDGVAVAVGEVVHRVDAPGVAGTVVVLAPDAVHHRVAQVLVAGLHVDLRAQDVGAVGILPGAHAPEDVEVLGGRAVAVGAHAARLVEAAAPRAHLLERLAVDVRLAGLHELLGDGVELLEVVRGKVEALLPVIAEPLDVGLDGPDELVLLHAGVGVVEAQVADGPGDGLRDAEVQGDALGVPDVQVAVGLGREARHHLAPVLAGSDVSQDEVEDEVGELLGEWPGAFMAGTRL